MLAQNRNISYSISRRNARSTEMHAFSPTKPPTLKTYKMLHEERIKKALAKLESSLSPNYSEIA